MAWERADPGARMTTYRYHANGQLELVTYPDGRQTLYTFDLRGRKATMAVTGQGTITYHYDAAGDMDYMTDAKGSRTSFAYDQAHRLVRTTRPDGKSIACTLEAAGRVTSLTDPKGTVFTLHYHDNGRRDWISWGAHTFTYAYDGNRPTNDGAISWSLDDAGRVAGVTGTGGVSATYSYEHPLGAMTGKSYSIGGDSVSVAYERGAAGQLLSIRQADAVNGDAALVFTERTLGGIPKHAEYRTGPENNAVTVLSADWKYDDNWNLKELSYKQDAAVLAGFRATHDGRGRRATLDILPTGEHFNYAYDGGGRLALEQRSYPGFAGTYGYDYDAVGNRATRTIAENGVNVGTEVYSYDANHALKLVQHPGGALTRFTHDDNGNTARKERVTPRTVRLNYRNVSGSTVRATLATNGVDLQTIELPATDPEEPSYSYVELPCAPWGLALRISAADAAFNDGASAKVDCLAVEIDNTWYLNEAEAGDVIMGVTSEYDTHASGSHALSGFGDAEGDQIAFASWVLPENVGDEHIFYSWDELNRLTDVCRYQNSALTYTGTFGYPGFGWQCLAQTITDHTGLGNPVSEERSFGYALGGELVRETIGGSPRTYVNGGVDQVLWARDGGNPSFYLNDVNGSVFGITDSSGNLLERQRFGAFGQTEITDVSGAIGNRQSQIGNRLGFQGRTNLGELGLQYFRNRFYDPSVGRFISADPLGMVDGPNVYGFCGGEPVNRADPMGLDYVWFCGAWHHVPFTSTEPTPPQGYEGKAGEVWPGDTFAKKFHNSNLTGNYYDPMGVNPVFINPFHLLEASPFASPGLVTDTIKEGPLQALKNKFWANVDGTPGLGTLVQAVQLTNHAGMEHDAFYIRYVHLAERGAIELFSFGLLAKTLPATLQTPKAPTVTTPVRILTVGPQMRYFVVRTETGVITEWLVGSHGKMPSPRPIGMQSHHPVNSAWAESCVPGYVAGDAPAILMQNEPFHNATRGVFNRLRVELAGRQGVKPSQLDWSKVSPGEAWRLAEEQSDAAGVPIPVREEYFRQFNRYLEDLR